MAPGVLLDVSKPNFEISGLMSQCMTDMLAETPSSLYFHESVTNLDAVPKSKHSSVPWLTDAIFFRWPKWQLD